jgi:Putative peptidoglycan-binding domain-containing protein
MTFSLIWLPHVLKSAGLKVATVPGWESRGRAEMGEIRGVICHHTGGERHGNMPTLQILIDGRPDLSGPLAQLGLGRDGTFYVIAAGRCNHAGAGIWNEVTNGNSNFIGIEAENTGGANDFPWPAVQVDAYQRGVAAILKFVGQPAGACAGHKEYARPLGRKQDPVFNMDEFRSAIDAILAGRGQASPLIPAVEPQAPNGGTARPTLRRSATRDPNTESLVKEIQRKLGVDQLGIFGPKTEAAVRELQRSLGMVPDGIVGPKTWKAIDALP